MTREQAKDLFRNDRDSYGKPKAIMSKLDVIFNDFDKLLALAEARFRAGEELILEPSALPTEGFLDNELYVKDYILWQQSIAAYEAAVKGEC